MTIGIVIRMAIGIVIGMVIGKPYIWPYTVGMATSRWFAAYRGWVQEGDFPPPTQSAEV